MLSIATDGARLALSPGAAPRRQAHYLTQLRRPNDISLRSEGSCYPTNCHGSSPEQVNGEPSGRSSLRRYYPMLRSVSAVAHRRCTGPTGVRPVS